LSLDTEQKAASSPHLPPPEPGTLRLVALGGLGEIGMNCLALEQGDDIMLVDCGVTFPTTDLGIDVYHPRFDYVLSRSDRLRGVVITHGHEDHIGALPYLLGALDEAVPIWGPPHALELARQRLAEHQFKPEDLILKQTRCGATFNVGSFQVESLRVTHSIADATALAIRTAAGLIIHTGDFKLDPTPVDGEVTDEARLRALGDEGVRLLMSDSTNVDSAGSSASEKDVGAALGEIVGRATARVVIGVFASNVQRLIMLGEIAQRTGRKILLLGRSVIGHVRAAESVGRLRWPSDLVVPPEVAASLPRDRLLVVASGTQAERMSSLTRLAAGVHPLIRLDAGDLVVLSSRVIPGNDRPVHDMMAGFLRLGAELITWSIDRRVHASGHAHRDEQARMMELTRPQGFMPLHGTLHHLFRHAGLAREKGIKDVLIAENGEVVELRADKPLAKAGRATAGKVATFRGEELAEDVIRERAQLGRMGIAFVAVFIDRQGQLMAPARVIERGVLEPYDDGVLRAAAKAVEQAVTESDSRTRSRDDDLSDVVRLATRRTIEGRTGRRPLVAVALTRI
jgi:ribonuclease J